MNKRKIMSSVVKSTNGVTYTPSLVTLEDGEDINSVHLQDTDILSGQSIQQILNSGDADTLWQNGEGLESINRKITEEKYQSTVTGDYAVNLGLGSDISGKGSVNIGYDHTTSGAYSLMLGQHNKNTGNFSAVGGAYNINTAASSLVSGYYAVNEGSQSIISGVTYAYKPTLQYNNEKQYYAYSSNYMYNLQLSAYASQLDAETDLQDIKLYLSYNGYLYIMCPYYDSDLSCVAGLKIVDDNGNPELPTSESFQAYVYENYNSANSSICVGGIITNAPNTSYENLSLSINSVTNGTCILNLGGLALGSNQIAVGNYSMLGTKAQNSIGIGACDVFGSNSIATGVSLVNFWAKVTTEDGKTLVFDDSNTGDVWLKTWDFTKALCPGTRIFNLKQKPWRVAKVVTCEKVTGEQEHSIIKITLDRSILSDGMSLNTNIAFGSSANVISPSASACISVGENFISGSHSLAVGYVNQIIGDCSLAAGYGLFTTNSNEAAFGFLNYSTTGSDAAGNTRFSVGIGLNNNLSDPDEYNRRVLRRNAFEIKQNGDVYVYGIGGYDGKRYQEAETLQNIINNLSQTEQSLNLFEVQNVKGSLGEITVSSESAQSDYDYIDFVFTGDDVYKFLAYRSSNNTYYRAWLEKKDTAANNIWNSSDYYQVSANMLLMCKNDGQLYYFVYSKNVSTQAPFRGYTPVYTLPTASSDTLGGIKIGTGLSIDDNGIVSGVGKIDPDSNGTGEIFNDYSNSATGEYSHAEGISTSAEGAYSHAEGVGSFATGAISHAEGSDGQAAGDISHVEGSQCVANGHTSHAEGNITITTNSNEHAQGTCNVSNTGSLDSDKTIHSIGIGLKHSERKNAQEVMTNGDHYIIGVGNYDGTNYSEAKTLQEVINGKQDSLVSGTSIKTINGQSILGKGNIDIESGSTGISDAPSDGKKYVRSNASWVEETTVDTSGFATKQEVTSQLQSKQNLIPIEQVSESEKEIQPDVYYMFGEKETLTITLASTDSDYYHEYMFEFNSGTTTTTLNVPETVKWIGDHTVEANKTYQVSIVNNLAVMGGA